MITELELWSVASVALLLGLTLGSSRQWCDVLNDHRRTGKSAIKGHLLLPFGRKENASGTVDQPLYSPALVLQFIKDVQAAFGVEKPFAHVRQKFTFDAISIAPELWRFRKLTPSTH